MSCDKSIRWGIIGCGDVVETKNGAPMYLAAHSELAGIWNRTYEKAAEWCSRHGHGRAYSSVDELLEDPTIDIIYVATTPNVHKKYACAVAAAGKNCYLEKPIALSWAEALEIQEAFQKAELRVLLLIIAGGCRATKSFANCCKKELLVKFGACKLLERNAKLLKKCSLMMKNPGEFVLKYQVEATFMKAMLTC
jgi:hypothetical protein